MSAQVHAHTHPKIAIKQAGFQHEDEIHAFYQRQKQQLGPMAYFLKGKDQAAIAGMLKRGGVFLARDGEDGPIAGMAAITPASFNPEGQRGRFQPDVFQAFTMATTAEVNSLVIAPNYARQGLATGLLQEVENWAKGRKLNHLFAKVVSGANINGVDMPGNTAGRSTFERHGYTQSGETERANDPNVKLWVLTKTLQPLN